MCEHARSGGLHEHHRTPLSSPGHKAQQFPAALFQEEGTTSSEAASAVVPGSQASSAQFYRRVYPSLRNLFLRLQAALSSETGKGDGIRYPHSDEKIAEVSDLLEQIDISDSEWKDFARFDGKTYTRNLIAQSEHFVVLLLGWNKKQRSPIHSHSDVSTGNMSSCWVKVLAGNIRERRFAWPENEEHRAAAKADPEAAAANGTLRLTGDCTLDVGGVCYINDTHGIHEMGNPNDNEVSVSLHVYSPPFYSCYAFTEQDCSARRVVSMLAATAPPREVLGPSSPVIEAVPSTDFSDSDAAKSKSGALAEKPNDAALQASETPPMASLPPPKSAAAMVQLRFEQDKQENLIKEIGGGGGASTAPASRERPCRSVGGAAPAGSISLIEFCKKLDTPTTTEKQAVELFSRLYLSKSEWSSFVHFSDYRYQRLMLHTDHNFSLMLLCWLNGQQTPPHDHKNSRSYVRVLAGELFYHEVDTDGSVIEGTAKTLSKRNTWDSPFVEDDSLAVHVVGNRGTDFAVSLHLYSPPYAELTYTESVGASVPAGGTSSSPASQTDAALSSSSCAASACASSTCAVKKTSHQVIPYAICQQMLTNLGNENSCNLLSNFYLLQEKLGLAFHSAISMSGLSNDVMELLEEQMFSPQELEEYWKIRDRIQHTCRIHDSEVFCVSINMWAPGHSTTIHDHGEDSLSWVKVLDGTLTDTLFEESTDGSCLEESNTSRLVTGSVTFYGTKAKHSLSNNSKSRRSISLHVYCSRTSVLGRSAAAGGGAAAASSEQQRKHNRLLPWGMQQGCRWYTRSHPKDGIKVISMTAVEDINWRPNIASQKKRMW